VSSSAPDRSRAGLAWLLFFVAIGTALAAIVFSLMSGGSSEPSVTSIGVGDVLFLSGSLGTKPGGGGLAEGGIQGQTRQALENLKASLALAGGSMEDISKCTVFLTDVKDFQAMNGVYREFFPANPPARTTVAVAGLVVEGAVIEIECIAAARK